MAAKTVFLHIGLPKTGTTSIQHALRQSGDFLSRNGIHYASAGSDSTLFDDPGHHLLAIYYMKDRWPELKIPFDPRAVDTSWDRLVEEIRDSQYSHVFVSSEWFAFDVYRHEDISDIRAKLADFEVRIVVVTRDIVELLNSLYSQRVRDGYVGTADEYVSLAWPHLDWGGLVQRWIDVFSRENVIVIKYHELSESTFVLDFLTRLKTPIADRESLRPPKFDNRRLPNGVVQALLEVNRSQASQDRKQALVWAIVTLCRDVPFIKGTAQFLSPEVEQRLRQHCREAPLPP